MVTLRYCQLSVANQGLSENSPHSQIARPEILVNREKGIMLFNNRIRRALAHAHCQWNGFAFVEPSVHLGSTVRARLKPHEIVFDDGNILVTEAGFVTMAIHIDRAIDYGEIVAVPGVDCDGVRGYMMLIENAIPYHSMQECVWDARLECIRSREKSRTLLAAYGNKSSLNAAAQRAPWYKMVNEQDLVCSGLCKWGAESFLRRFKLRALARRYGLPRLILRFAGPYGARLTAARLLRGKLG